jgi:isoaspartyl peptidase/L-asparaginase-like protein (Ntn-hydrolase superfamily)
VSRLVIVALVALVALVASVACSSDPASPSSSSPMSPATSPVSPATLPPRPWAPAAIAHCGAGTPPSAAGGCAPAIAAALAVLARGGGALDAAVAGAAVLEDDPRYNAGTGSAVRLDGHAVQMDAAVMDSRGRFGAVAGVEEVRHPIEVARAVLDTPHRLLAGAGASAFARAIGHAPWDPRTPARVAAAEALRGKLAAADPSLPAAWRGFDWRRAWNYPTPPPAATAPLAAAAAPGNDTIGVLVRDADGGFAAALSSGGYALVLSGRVGDVPIPGAGLYAGPYGAVAATGRGEKIIDADLARTVYRWLEAGVPVDEAVRRGVDLVDEAALIAITPTGYAAEARPPMAWCASPR